MATPTWNQIAAPNFSAGNDLIVQAMNQLTKATTGFKSIADQYKDTIQKRNLGLIQEYVNSAKTPEELQSEAFQTGLAKLTGGMEGEYDTLAKAQLVDKAADTLLSRKAANVSIDTNQFNLDTGRKTQRTKEFTNKVLAAPLEQRNALIQAAIDANAFDPSAYQNYVQGEGTIRNQNNANELFWATYDATVKNANLAPKVTEQNMANDRRRLELEAKRIELEEQKISGNNNNGFTVAQGEEALDKILGGIRENQKNALLNVRTKMPYKDMTEVDAEIRKTQIAEWWLPATAKKSKDIIMNSPTLSKLPASVKAAIYKGMVDRITANNIGGKMDWISQDDATYRKVALDAAKESIGYLLNANTMENALIQDGANKLMRMSNANGGKPLSFEEASAYLNKQLGSSPLNEYNVGNIVLNELDKEEVKRAEDKLRKAGNSVLPQGGFGLQLGGNMVVTQNPVVVQAQPKAIYKDEKAGQSEPVNQAITTTTSPQSKIGTSSQYEAITPIVNSLISTPLGITTNPSTVKTKPVVDPLRQAALEQSPLSVSNTAQSIMGTKIEDKQALARKAFPNTPLTKINKAAEPVVTPLLPAQSQNAHTDKANNLTIDLRTGKSTPAKDPVAIPNVEWSKPVEVVKINPILAQLPQYKAVVTFAGDADTFYAKSDKYTTKGRESESSNIECRVDSIDAPETAHPAHGKRGQPYGEEAAKILQQMVLNKEVSIRVTKPTDGTSNYGRDVCQIEVSGKDVSVELLRAGAAWLYQYKDPRTGEDYNRYGSAGIRLEQEARDAKKGLWALPNPQNPFDFRQQEKRRQRGY